MNINSVESTGSWTFKIPSLILGIYFLIILPCKQILFREYPWLYKNTEILFIVIAILYVLYKFNLVELGFSLQNLNQNIVLGSIVGGIILISIPLLNYLIETTGLSEHKLFIEQASNNQSHKKTLIIEKTSNLLITPIIEQIFFTGFILQSILKKTSPIIGIYVTSLIYTIFGFNLTLGRFGLGLGASILFKLTGTIYASIIFHICCLIGWELLINVYPRLMILFGFLY